MYSDRRAVVLFPVLLCACCSIWEDRAACPCALALEISDLPVDPAVVSVEGEGYTFLEVVHADTLMVLPVPKEELSVSVVGGALAEGDGSVRIAEGEEAPPLYLFHASVPAFDEQVTLPVLLRKQYCRLELLFSGPPGYGPPFEVQVEGSYDGWLRDGSPSEGPFSRRLLPGSDGRATLRLPRQGDDSLLMHIVFSDRIVRTFALGSYIAASGYDWSAPDLADLSLQVDISLTTVTISTDLWTKTEDLERWI
jgi:hypothetical protein